MQFPKITVVVNKIKKSILYPAVAVKLQRCDVSVWPGGDILTFVSSLGNSNKEEHYSFLFLPLLHSWGGGEIYISSCVNEHKLTAGVCVCYLSPEKWSFLSNCSISHTSYPAAFICLTGTLMILKSACSYNASYIDRLISVFMRSLQKMVREHLSPQQANPGVTETSTGT